MINHFKYLIVVFIALIAVTCKVSEKTTVPRNLERIYDPSSSSIHPQIKIYNTSDTTSLIVAKVFTKELLFNQANPENKLLARIKVIYNLYDLNNRHNLVDSTTTTFKFKKNSNILYQQLEVPVNAEIGNDYILEVITTDLNRNSNQYSFFKVDRTEENNSNDFLIYNRLNNVLLTDLYIDKKQQIKIDHYKLKLDSLHVFFIPNDFKVPHAPFMEDTATDNYKNYDTTWVCYTDSVNFSDFKDEGVYYFSVSFDLNYDQEGFALYNFGEGYPIVRTPSDLIKPIIYLGSVDTISNSDSTGKLTKLVVDNFWLDKANNIDKSRELLKEYYNRVMFANTYFTSYKEGWQTDRGMIYIIYGDPDYLFKSGEEERWIYNPNGIGPGIEFKFNYVKHPLTLNHYILDREKLKTTGWNEAVKLWNTGEVFYYQN